MVASLQGLAGLGPGLAAIFQHATAGVERPLPSKRAEWCQLIEPDHASTIQPRIQPRIWMARGSDAHNQWQHQTEECPPPPVNMQW